MAGRIVIKELTATLLLTAATSAAGQSLVTTVDNPLHVTASYGYSQVHHDGEWIRVDVGVKGAKHGTMKPHEAFSLLTPDGERIDLPNQREYRAGFAEIQSMRARADLQLSPWLAISQCMTAAFAGFDDIPGEWNVARPCKTWRLWGNGGVDWAVSIGPGYGAGGAVLFFHSLDGWPPGEYWLEVDGPGDLAARLPVRLH